MHIVINRLKTKFIRVQTWKYSTRSREERETVTRKCGKALIPVTKTAIGFRADARSSLVWYRYLQHLKIRICLFAKWNCSDVLSASLRKDISESVIILKEFASILNSLFYIIFNRLQEKVFKQREGSQFHRPRTYLPFLINYRSRLVEENRVGT